MIFETHGFPTIFDYVSYIFSKFKCIVKVCEGNHDDLAFARMEFKLFVKEFQKRQNRRYWF